MIGAFSGTHGSAKLFRGSHHLLRKASTSAAEKAAESAVHTPFYVLLIVGYRQLRLRRAFRQRSTSTSPRRWQRAGLVRSMLPQRGLPLTKCRGRAAIGPARRNPNSPQALPEEFDPP